MECVCFYFPTSLVRVELQRLCKDSQTLINDLKRSLHSQRPKHAHGPVINPQQLLDMAASE